MVQKLALAEAMPSPFFQLALDVQTPEQSQEPEPAPTLRIVGESASELGLALGAALILEGSPPAVAAGIAVITASLLARRKMKKRA